MVFDDAKIKVEWACELVGALQESTHSFIAEQRCEVFSEHDPVTKELRITPRGEYAPVPPFLTLLSGTCAQVINSGLDYVASEIVNSARHTDRRIVFPMDVDQDRLAQSSAIKTIRKVNTGLADFILNEIKPTKIDNFPIWGIRSLANTDKHRNLVLTVHLQGIKIARVKRDDMTITDFRFGVGAGTQNDGCLTIPHVEEYSDPEPLVQVTFNEPDVFHRTVFHDAGIVDFLADGIRATASVINAVEGFMRR